MGYGMQQLDSDFRIKHENFQQALNAIQSMYDETNRNCIRKYSVEDSLPDELDEWDWQVEVDKAGDITGVCFVGDRMGSELDLFTAIAPYVENGSYINMIGDDLWIWQWYFDDGIVMTYRGEIVFPESPTYKE